MTSNDKYVLQLLVERGFLTPEQVDDAAKSMKAENETTLDVLVSSGVIGEDEVLIRFAFPCMPRYTCA